jgi:hypothetical protein
MKIETLPRAPALPLPPGRSRRWKALAIGAAALALGAGGWTIMQSGKKPAPAAVAQGGADKGGPKVDVYELSRGDVAAIAEGELQVNLPLSGSLTPQTQATVKSKVSGVVLGATVRRRHAASPPARCWPGSTRPTSAPAWPSSRPRWTKRRRACRWRSRTMPTARPCSSKTTFPRVPTTRRPTRSSWHKRASTPCRPSSTWRASPWPTPSSARRWPAWSANAMCRPAKKSRLTCRSSPSSTCAS